MPAPKTKITLEEFFNLCGENNVAITYKFKGIDWQTWIELTELSKKFNYRCEFKEDGECYGIKHGHWHTDNAPPGRCCCTGCEKNFGYLKWVPPDVKILKLYASKWRKDTGFWRKTGGCSLPIHLRAGTCLRHACEASVRMNPLDVFIKGLMDEHCGLCNPSIMVQRLRKLLNVIDRRTLKRRKKGSDVWDL